MAEIMCEYCTFEERAEGSRYCEECLRELVEDEDQGVD